MSNMEGPFRKKGHLESVQYIIQWNLRIIIIIIIIIIIRLYNTVGEENRVVREVNRDRLC